MSEDAKVAVLRELPNYETTFLLHPEMARSYTRYGMKAEYEAELAKRRNADGTYKTWAETQKGSTDADV